MKQATNSNDFTGLRRGDRVNGGRFVGMSPRGVWICWGGDLAFARMCAAFDALFSPMSPSPQFAAVA